MKSLLASKLATLIQSPTYLSQWKRSWISGITSISISRVITSTINGSIFCLFVISDNGMLGREALVVIANLSRLMAEKMDEQILHVRGWVRYWISITLAISYSWIIHRDRLPSPLWYRETHWDLASGLGLAHSIAHQNDFAHKAKNDSIPPMQIHSTPPPPFIFAPHLQQHTVANSREIIRSKNKVNQCIKQGLDNNWAEKGSRKVTNMENNIVVLPLPIRTGSELKTTIFKIQNIQMKNEKSFFDKYSNYLIRQMSLKIDLGFKILKISTEKLLIIIYMDLISTWKGWIDCLYFY